MAAPLPLTRTARRPGVVPRRAWTFSVALAIALALLSLVPYLLAYGWTPSGKQFGGFFFIADDATTYLAKMRQGAEGSWLWTDPYTSEPHTGVFLFGFYLLFGHLAALLHLPLIAAYHLARVSGGIVLVLAIDRIAGRLLADPVRRLGVGLAMLGSGVGFLAQAAGNPAVFGERLEALDLHLPELSGWYSMLAIPHFAWAAALIVLSLLGLLALDRRPSLRLILATGLGLTALAAIHPQMVPVLFLVWLAYRTTLLAWKRPPALRSVISEGLAFAVAAPLVAYNALVLVTDPTIASWAHQWRHQAPGPLSLGLGLGLPLAAAGIGAAIACRRRDPNLALLVVWPLVVFALLYLPNPANIQRRLLDAVFVPIGLLAAVGWREGLARLPQPRARRLERLLVPACCVSSALVLAIAVHFAAGALPEMYLADDQSKTLSWLSTHHRPADRALSSPQAGLFLPASSGVDVYVGHYSETLDYFAKIHRVDDVLGPSATPAAVESFFEANGITLLYWGPDERAGLSFDPEGQRFLQRIYAAGSVAIYRFLPN